MNKYFSSTIAAVLLLVMPLAGWNWLHDSLAARESAVLEAWSETQASLQQRSDLIPALVDIVSRYLRDDSASLSEIDTQRNDATLAAALDELIAAQERPAEPLPRYRGTRIESAADLAELIAAQQRVAQQLRHFLAVAESYPALRSSGQFLELRGQFEDTERRINVARMRFNEHVAAYNAATGKLPGSLVASVGGFETKAYFRTDEHARYASKLEFE